MNLLKNTIVASAIALSMSNSASAATLDINASGVLMGAFGVNVNDSFYDVTFGDGLMKDNMTAFKTADDATVASKALLDQVLLGIFDSNPAITNGCTNQTICNILTGYESYSYLGTTYFRNAVAVNQNSTSNDSQRNMTFSAFTDLASYANVTLARWKPSEKKSAATAVPEAEVYAMMLAGLGVVGFAARRKKQKTTRKALSQY